MIEATNNIQWVLSNKSVFLPQDHLEAKKCFYMLFVAVILVSAVVCVAVIKEFCPRKVEDFMFQ